MYDTNKIVNKILGSPIRKDSKSKNNEKQIGEYVTQTEFDKIKEWFTKRFPESSFDEFVEKTKLKTK